MAIASKPRSYKARPGRCHQDFVVRLFKARGLHIAPDVLIGEGLIRAEHMPEFLIWHDKVFYRTSSLNNIFTEVKVHRIYHVKEVKTK